MTWLLEVKLSSGIIIRQMKIKNKTVILFAVFSISYLFIALYPYTLRAELKGEAGRDQIKVKELPSREKKEGKHKVVDVSGVLFHLGKGIDEVKTVQTDFVQEKDLSIFQKKIILKGRIYLEKPYKIAWYVEEPIKYKILITDKIVRQWDEDTNEINEILISSNSIFKNIIDQLTIWFSGQYISMLEKYDINIKNQQPYILEFIPREMSILKKTIKSITVVFREDARYLKQIEFREISGDTTVITLENTLLNAPLDDSYFRIEPVKLGWDFSSPSIC